MTWYTWLGVVLAILAWLGVLLLKIGERKERRNAK